MKSNWASAAIVALLALAHPVGAEEDKASPFAEAAKPAALKPSERAWAVMQQGKRSFGYTFSMKPGVPDKGQLTEVIITVNEIPKTPHPRFGSRVPLDNAEVVLELVSPAGEVVGRYVAHAMPLASGQYGVHLTPAQDGIYSVGLRGKTADGVELRADLKLPVNVWPLPKELEGTGEAVAGRRSPVLTE